MKAIIPLLLLSVFLFSSCKKEYQVEYYIINSIGQKMSIVYKDAITGVVDSNAINHGQTLTFKVEMGTEQNTCDYLDNLDALPFEFIRIRSISGEVPNFDEQDINEWSKNYPKKKEGVGSISLFVYRSKFY